MFHNMATVSNDALWVDRVKAVTLLLLEDERPEVRVQASVVLGGLLHCNFLPKPRDLLQDFTVRARAKLNARTGQDVRIRHAAVLGMCAFINAHPYSVPDYLPTVFRELGKHLNDPQPIPVS